MSKILVTGGAGFIGSHVVDQLVEAGHDVVVVDNLVTGKREFVNPAAEFVEMDIRADGLADVFAEHKPELVDHLAAQINVTLSLKKPVYDAENNVLGTVNVLQRCVEHGVKKLIFSSSSGAIYGEPADLPVSEDSTPAPISHYGVSKLAGEEYIRLYGRIYDLPFTVLRYSNVYGPRQLPQGEAGVCAILTELMLQGKRSTLYGRGEAVRDYVYVGDVARANVLALDKGAGATVNVASGKGTTVLEIFGLLKDIIGFQEDPILKPLRPGEVFKIYATRDRAERLLGWRPEVSLEEGLRRTVEYFRELAGS